MLPGAAGIAGFFGGEDDTIELAATVGPSAKSTSHSFSSVNFGSFGANRFLIVFIFGQEKNAGIDPGAAVNITSMLVGGASPLSVHGVPPLGFYFNFVDAATTDFAGVTSGVFQPAVSSGNITFTTGIATQCSVVVLNVPLITSVSSGTYGGDWGFEQEMDFAVDVPSNGIITAGAIRHSTQNITTTNITKRSSFNHVGTYTCAIGFDRNLPPQSGRHIKFSGTSPGPTSASSGDSWS